MFQLRYLQTLNSISAENNSTIVFPVPIDIMSSFMPPATGKESILSWMMGCIILFLSAIVVTVQNAEYFACCYQLSNVDPRNNPWNMLQTARRFEFDILISARNCCICITLMQMTGNKKLLLNQWEQKWWCNIYRWTSGASSQHPSQDLSGINTGERKKGVNPGSGNSLQSIYIISIHGLWFCSFIQSFWQKKLD